MRAAAVIVLLAGTLAPKTMAQSPVLSPDAPQMRPNYLDSPFQGMRNGDGQIIPCRCRFAGRRYMLGEQVCMSTPSGVVMTRCDLIDNNTSWIPTEKPCELKQSRLPGPSPAQRSALSFAGMSPFFTPASGKIHMANTENTARPTTSQ